MKQKQVNVQQVMTKYGIEGDIKQIYSTAWNIGDEFVLKKYVNFEELKRNVDVLSILYSEQIPVPKIIATPNNEKYLKDKDMETAIKELESGIPVQYIVGNVDFYGNTFKVNKNTLIPRFETELLVEKTIKYINMYFNNEIKILDIGTGSGCIAITLNKLLDNSMVTAVDISKEALDVARENNKINNTDVNFIKSDVFSNINDKYDVIISNPPYISYDEDIMDVVYNNEPHMALYADDNGLYFYDKILNECRKYLNDRFIIAFEIGYKQGNDILNIINKYFDNVNISLEKDYSGRDRFIFIWNH